MSKHALVGILVLCFVSTFMTMLFQYASNGWKYETNPPLGGHSPHHRAAATPGHETPMPGGAVATPMVVTEESPAPVESATPATPVESATPEATPEESPTPATPEASPTP